MSVATHPKLLTDEFYYVQLFFEARLVFTQPLAQS